MLSILKSSVKGLLIAIVVFILIIGYSMASKGDQETATLMEDEYCQMVDLYNESKGHQGWPDFKGNYNDVCL